MYRIHQIKLNIGEDKDKIPEKILRKIGVRDGVLQEWHIVKESLDSRDKSNIKWVYSVDFKAASRKNPKKELRLKDLEIAPDMEYVYPVSGEEELAHRPVIVGFGPAGMMAGLILAQRGYKPLVLERGQKVEDRVRTIEEFQKTRKLDANSNIQFGEGGAGTFSDGKLTTGIKDKRIRKVLKEFVKAGAPEEILYKQKPHVGTDILRVMVKNIRKEIEKLGGEILFDTQFVGIETEAISRDAACAPDGRRLKAIRIRNVRTGEEETIETEVLVLAVGHSARDTFRMLKDKLSMKQKPFSMGFRIEHPQDVIDIAQYGKPARELGLPVADYKLSHHTAQGRGVYTFCMCPGGQVVCAASVEGMTLTNGMSYHDRASGVANSALLCDVRPEDYDVESDGDVLAGVRFQEKYERLAYENAGADYSMPSCTLGDLADENALTNSLPKFVIDNIIEAVPHLGRKLKGFDDPSSKITGPETRSSSPVRILRDENLEASIKGIYPAGEGAGYAGGITSSACDGIRIAEMIISKYRGWK